MSISTWTLMIKYSSMSQWTSFSICPCLGSWLGSNWCGLNIFRIRAVNPIKSSSNLKTKLSVNWLVAIQLKMKLEGHRLNSKLWCKRLLSASQVIVLSLSKKLSLTIPTLNTLLSTLLSFVEDLNKFIEDNLILLCSLRVAIGGCHEVFDGFGFRL